MKNETLPKPEKESKWPEESFATQHEYPELCYSNVVRPDVFLQFVPQCIVVDHSLKEVWILRLQSPIPDNAFETIIQTCKSKSASSSDARFNTTTSDPAFEFRAGEEQYQNLVKRCIAYLKAGHSYELCLTTPLKLTTEIPEETVLYKSLRKKNPAPYGCFLQVPAVSGSAKTTVLSSSPERFLKVSSNGVAEAKPIKGTCKRGATTREDNEMRKWLGEDVKNLAENLMIVDLIRNDLAHVCNAGSVHCLKLMDVESYETVHQLVSTVRGKVASDKTTPDVVSACFPPGSMTGAPKQRSCEILESLEGNCPRNAYSGALGYFSLNGACDLAVVIRTMFLDNGRDLTAHAGGAVTVLSDPADEYSEMVLKTTALKNAIQACKTVYYIEIVDCKTVSYIKIFIQVLAASPKIIQNFHHIMFRFARGATNLLLMKYLRHYKFPVPNISRSVNTIFRGWSRVVGSC